MTRQLLLLSRYSDRYYGASDEVFCQYITDVGEYKGDWFPLTDLMEVVVEKKPKSIGCPLPLSQPKFKSLDRVFHKKLLKAYLVLRTDSELVVCSDGPQSAELLFTEHELLRLKTSKQIMKDLNDIQAAFPHDFPDGFGLLGTKFFSLNGRWKINDLELLENHIQQLINQYLKGIAYDYAADQKEMAELMFGGNA